MVSPSPLTRAWLHALSGPFWASLCGLVIASVVLLTGQTVVQAHFVPRLSGVLSVAAGFLPEMIGTLAPVALLFASVTAGRLWSEGGDMLALGTAGRSALKLIPACALAGLLVAAGVGVCTHLLGPMGRGVVRAAVIQAVDDLHLRPGQPVAVGDGVLRVGAEEDGEVSGVFFASGDVVLWAPSGHLAEGGEISLVDGQAMPLDASWRLEFERAGTALQAERPGIHEFERTSASLLTKIHRMESKGKDASKERLTLYKRTTLPASVPILAMLGLPLGACFRRPGRITVSVVLGIWVVQRLGDHLVFDIGPSGMALLPLVLLGLSSLLAWLGWRAR